MAAVPSRGDPHLRSARHDVAIGVALGLALCLTVLFVDWFVARRLPPGGRGPADASVTATMQEL